MSEAEDALQEAWLRIRDTDPENIGDMQAWLTAGAIGLLIGFAVPVLGKVAAVGLVLYFICAISAHLRARDPGFGGAVFFLALAICALVANLAYHGHW